MSSISFSKKRSVLGMELRHIKLCSNAVCLLLHLSRSHLYDLSRIEKDGTGNASLSNSIINEEGLRMRSCSRKRQRTSFPAIIDLKVMSCYCDERRFKNLRDNHLSRKYESFRELRFGINAQERENRLILHYMLCGMMTSTILLCDKSIYALFKMALSRVKRERSVLNPLLRSKALKIKGNCWERIAVQLSTGTSDESHCYLCLENNREAY